MAVGRGDLELSCQIGVTGDAGQADGVIGAPVAGGRLFDEAQGWAGITRSARRSWY